MEMFTPSLDWGDESVASALWVAKAWVFAAIGMVLVSTLVARYTTWGRQFWRITGDYFTGRESIPVWALLGVLLMSVMIAYAWSCCSATTVNDQFSAMQAAFEGEVERKMLRIRHRGFWIRNLDSRRAGHRQGRPHPARHLPDAALHHPLAGVAHPSSDRDWLDGRRLLPSRGSSTGPIDNPDQRIQQDIDIFTTGTGPETNTPTVGTAQTLLFGRSSRSCRWSRSPRSCGNSVRPADHLRRHVPKALFWIACSTCFVTTVVAFWIGRPLIRLSFRNEMTNAAFRYALVRLRDAARGGRLLSRREAPNAAS